jgi:hypothetical protein
MAKTDTNETINIICFYVGAVLFLTGLTIALCSCGESAKKQPQEIKNAHGQTTVILEGYGLRDTFVKWLSENKDKKIISMTSDWHGSFAAITYEEPPVIVKEIPKCKECGRPYPCEKGEQK